MSEGIKDDFEMIASKIKEDEYARAAEELTDIFTSENSDLATELYSSRIEIRRLKAVIHRLEIAFSRLLRMSIHQLQEVKNAKNEQEKV